MFFIQSCSNLETETFLSIRLNMTDEEFKTHIDSLEKKGVLEIVNRGNIANRSSFNEILWSYTDISFNMPLEGDEMLKVNIEYHNYSNYGKLTIKPFSEFTVDTYNSLVRIYSDKYGNPTESYDNNNGENNILKVTKWSKGDIDINISYRYDRKKVDSVYVQGEGMQKLESIHYDIEKSLKINYEYNEGVRRKLEKKKEDKKIKAIDVI